MSQENVEIVRRIYDAWNEGAVPAGLDLFDDRVELRLNIVMGSYRGREGVRKFVTDLIADWSQLSMTIEDTVVHGDQVLVVVREEGVGRASHAPITSIEHHVWAVRDGKAVSADAYSSRARALEAVGLRA